MLSVSPATLWFIIIGISLGALAARTLFLLVADRVEIPPLVRRALRFVPAAALSAIVLPALLARSGQIDISLHNERLIAGAVAGLVAWRTRNVLLTIGVGMALLWVLQR
jgi:branched-subunit amino acid transport protein